jgi:CheY-like chemotaxis protein
MRVLRSLGYQPIEAENGFDALNVIKARGMSGIDLVLTDVTMPKMGGRELVETIWADHPGTRVVFTSGAPGADVALKTMFAHPGTVFLHKPFTPSDLARVVRGVLGQVRVNGVKAVNGAAVVGAGAGAAEG